MYPGFVAWIKRIKYWEYEENLPIFKILILSAGVSLTVSLINSKILFKQFYRNLLKLEVNPVENLNPSS